jgi:hypothetical protein
MQLYAAGETIDRIANLVDLSEGQVRRGCYAKQVSPSQMRTEIVLVKSRSSEEEESVCFRPGGSGSCAVDLSSDIVRT